MVGTAHGCNGGRQVTNLMQVPAQGCQRGATGQPAPGGGLLSGAVWGAEAGAAKPRHLGSPRQVPAPRRQPRAGAGSAWLFGSAVLRCFHPKSCTQPGGALCRQSVLLVDGNSCRGAFGAAGCPCPSSARRGSSTSGWHRERRDLAAECHGLVSQAAVLLMSQSLTSGGAGANCRLSGGCADGEEPAGGGQRTGTRQRRQ